jgi:hypothetical protein
MLGILEHTPDNEELAGKTQGHPVHDCCILNAELRTQTRNGNRLAGLEVTVHYDALAGALATSRR